MGKAYRDFANAMKNAEAIDWIGALKLCFATDKLISCQQYAKQLPESVSVDRMRYVLKKLEDMGKLQRIGTGRGSKYKQVGSLDGVEL